MSKCRQCSVGRCANAVWARFLGDDANQSESDGLEISASRGQLSGQTRCQGRAERIVLVKLALVFDIVGQFRVHCRTYRAGCHGCIGAQRILANIKGTRSQSPPQSVSMGIVDDRAMNADRNPIMAAKSKPDRLAVPMMSEQPTAAGP